MADRVDGVHAEIEARRPLVDETPIPRDNSVTRTR
jgi:hypothetical protein